MTTQKDSFAPAQRIAHSIVLIQGEKVLLDRDLAAVYSFIKAPCRRARNIQRLAYTSPTPCNAAITVRRLTSSRSPLNNFKRALTCTA